MKGSVKKQLPRPPASPPFQLAFPTSSPLPDGPLTRNSRTQGPSPTTTASSHTVHGLDLLFIRSCLSSFNKPMLTAMRFTDANHQTIRLFSKADSNGKNCFYRLC